MSSPTTHTAKTEWHIPVKAKVHIYYHDFGQSKDQIAKALDIDRYVVRDILSKPVRREINFRGRYKALNSNDVQRLIQKVCENYTTQIFTWEDLEAACDLDVSVRTIKRAMNEAEFHKCNICHHSFITAVEATKRVF